MKHYRSYGEWWEAGQKPSDLGGLEHRKSSRFWPFGQDVTKVYQTLGSSHQYRLDDRFVEKARFYVPPRSGSLPDLRSFRGPAHSGGARAGGSPDGHYQTAFHGASAAPPPGRPAAAAGLRAGR